MTKKSYTKNILQVDPVLELKGNDELYKRRGVGDYLIVF